MQMPLQKLLLLRRLLLLLLLLLLSCFQATQRANGRDDLHVGHHAMVGQHNSIVEAPSSMALTLAFSDCLSDFLNCLSDSRNCLLDCQAKNTIATHALRHS